MEQEEEEQVMSEVHLGCPPRLSGPHVSYFTFSFPPELECIGSKYYDLFGRESVTASQNASVDEDGDLVVPRRREISIQKCGLAIRHNVTSSIPSVGLQVWRAELILADYVLHKMLTSSDFDEVVALELGAGTGLVGILLARVAEKVYLTDRGENILDNCDENVRLNYGRFNFKGLVVVRELDWKSLWPPTLNDTSRYSWTLSELEGVQTASLLIAADVIYSDDLTDALFSTLQKLMSEGSEKVLYLALEKRYNFSLDDLDVVANGYIHFRSYMRDNDSQESQSGENKVRAPFVGRRINLSEIPQYVKEYERGKDVELWEIRHEKPNQSISL